MNVRHIENGSASGAQGADDLHLVATMPVIRPPAWAVLQRHLFDVLDEAWRAFEKQYCEPDGRLAYSGQMFGRDGVDDFYEPFFNWPILYNLGGSADLLAASKKHWEGVTAQITEVGGFMVDEYERAYDWFHQGESLIFFYALCAADPSDEKFKARAMRFARLYLGDSATGNYDAEHRMIVAPHTGAGGPRWGVGEDWETYPATQLNMKRYGLPLHDVEGITSWSDLEDPANAQRMGDAMQARMGAGDTAINLAATSLVANAWLYDHEAAFSDWIAEYVGAWRERADANGGLIPDNVGPDGQVGALHGGDWFGGHYGWTWPHGLLSIESAVLVAATNDALVNGNADGWQLARVPLDTVLGQAKKEVFRPEESTLGNWWRSRLGDDIAQPVQIVPYRFGPNGWFDWHPMQLIFPFWLWWMTGNESDTKRLVDVLDDAGYDWRTVKQFRDKEESGHEATWFAWLRGENPSYPEVSLEMALGQVAQRLALIRNDDGSQGNDIHWWQQVNPVATEILTQQISGAPAAIYNGGLPLARVRYWDASTQRPGLPPEVSALVTRIDGDEVEVTLVNLNPSSTRELILQAGEYGEDRINDIEYDELDDEWPGPVHGRTDITAPVSSVRQGVVGTNRLTIALPPLTQIHLTLSIDRGVMQPRHRTFVS